MACHQEILLDTNADCAEFCADEKHHDLLAVGTYQLDQDSTTRHGRLYLYSLRAAAKQGGHQLQQLATLDVPGIFDLQWATLPRSSDAPCIGLALADGTLRIVALQQERGAAEADECCQANSQTAHETGSHGLQDQDTVILQELCSCHAVSDSMALYLDWHPQRPGIAAVSSSAGSVSLSQVHASGVEQLCEWKAHDLEAWIASWDRHKANVLYSGSDDSTFKGWDTRIPSSSSSSSSNEEPQQTAIFSNRRAHTAGVTCISSHPRQEHVLVTGSYDEHVRLWDVRMIHKPLETCQVSTGGGVWRLKWHPRDDHLLLAACMYQGFALVSAAKDWGSLQVVQEYKGHESIAYGADWYQGRLGGCRHNGSNPAASQEVLTADVCGNGSSSTSGEQQCSDLVATCSFYDRKLHLWSPEKFSSN